VAGKQQLALMRKKVMSSADQGLSNLGITYVVPFRCTNMYSRKEDALLLT